MPVLCLTHTSKCSLVLSAILPPFGSPLAPASQYLHLFSLPSLILEPLIIKTAPTHFFLTLPPSSSCHLCCNFLCELHLGECCATSMHLTKRLITSICFKLTCLWLSCHRGPVFLHLQKLYFTVNVKSVGDIM